MRMEGNVIRVAEMEWPLYIDLQERWGSANTRVFCACALLNILLLKAFHPTVRARQNESTPSADPDPDELTVHAAAVNVKRSDETRGPRMDE